MTKNEFINLRENGLTYKQIGESLGVSKQRVHQIYAKYETEKKYKIYKCVKCGNGFSKNDRKYIDTICPICNECKMNRIKANYWSPKHYLQACAECGRNDIKHQGDGLCVTCYSRRRYNTDPIYRESQKKSADIWKKNNVEKVRITNIRANKKYNNKKRLNNR